LKLINNDCIAAMKEMPDNSMDSIVTDPPYELGFMGKSWDSSGIAFNVEVWTEALRVLKPGGHLIAFSGSRTYHRMAVAIEDAGFEIRDQIMWIYGSGFPKSHNISKGINKAAGAEREVIGKKPYTNQDIRNNAYDSEEARERPRLEALITAPATDAAKQWDGWGTALKPAHEPMVLARKPLIGTVANNVLTYGVGGLNIDGARVGSKQMGGYPVNSSLGRRTSDGGEHSDFVATTATGRWPANIIHDGSDEVVELFPDSKGKVGMSKQASSRGLYEGGKSLGDTKINDGIADLGSAARFFYCAKASKRDRNEGLDGFEAFSNGVGALRDKGRKSLPRANHHPTVKPTNLMRYLCKLVTPPNGTVLDPFMGSGSTGKAAIFEGFDFIGIEQSEEYIKIAEARINWVKENQEKTLF